MAGFEDENPPSYEGVLGEQADSSPNVIPRVTNDR